MTVLTIIWSLNAVSRSSVTASGTTYRLSPTRFGRSPASSTSRTDPDRQPRSSGDPAVLPKSVWPYAVS
jgi:hypothetical protein